MELIPEVSIWDLTSSAEGRGLAAPILGGGGVTSFDDGGAWGLAPEGGGPAGLLGPVGGAGLIG